MNNQKSFSTFVFSDRLINYYHLNESKNSIYSKYGVGAIYDSKCPSLVIAPNPFPISPFKSSDN